MEEDTQTHTHTLLCVQNTQHLTCETILSANVRRSPGHQDIYSKLYSVWGSIINTDTDLEANIGGFIFQHFVSLEGVGSETFHRSAGVFFADMRVSFICKAEENLEAKRGSISSILQCCLTDRWFAVAAAVTLTLWGTMLVWKKGAEPEVRSFKH